MLNIGGNKMSDIQTISKTGAAAIAYTLTPYFAFELLSVRIKLDVAPTTSENFTITVDANGGAVHDVVICSDDLATHTSYIWPVQSIGNLHFEAGDKLLFAWTNTDTKTWGLQVKYRRKV